MLRWSVLFPGSIGRSQSASYSMPQYFCHWPVARGKLYRLAVTVNGELRDDSGVWLVPSKADWWLFFVLSCRDDRSRESATFIDQSFQVSIIEMNKLLYSLVIFGVSFCLNPLRLISLADTDTERCH